MSAADLDAFNAAIAQPDAVADTAEVVKDTDEKSGTIGAKKPTPWDMTPAKPKQVAYLKKLLEGLSAFDWSSIDTTQASSAISQLNGTRQLVRIPFTQYEDF